MHDRRNMATVRSLLVFHPKAFCILHRNRQWRMGREGISGIWHLSWRYIHHYKTMVNNPFAAIICLSHLILDVAASRLCPWGIWGLSEGSAGYIDLFWCIGPKQQMRRVSPMNIIMYVFYMCRMYRGSFAARRESHIRWDFILKWRNCSIQVIEISS